MSISKKDKILDLFFNEHWKQVDIAKELNVSKQHVSKIVTADSRYEIAKQEKLQKNAIKRKEYQKEYFKTYKRPKREDNSYEQLKAQQKKDSMELSYYSGGISDYAFVMWNLSAYHRNKKGNLALNKGLNVGFDIPRILNMNIKIPTQKYKHVCMIRN